MSPKPTVIVTGAARGLGYEMAVGLAEAGFHVIAMCRPGLLSADASDAGLPVGDRLARYDGDVTDVGSCAGAVEFALTRFGSLDVVVNNAALSHDTFLKFHDSEFGDIPVDDWRRQFDVNVTGPFLMARAVVPHLRSQGWGRIINLSTSMSTMLAAGVLPYGPTKAALEAMSVGWAAHLKGTGVTVNELLPGGPAGPRVPQKHWWGADLAVWPGSIMVPPLVWLASRASDGVTGQRFIARLWDPDLPPAEAARRAGHPGGWPSSEAEHSQSPRAIDT